MPVVDEAGLVVGVLSEADILAKEGGEQERKGFLQWFLDPTDPWVAARFDAVTVGEAMSSPAKTISPHRPVAEAATLMLEERVNRLPVVDVDGKLVGLVSRGDLVRAFARSDAEIQREIEEDVLRRVMWLDPSDVQRHRQRRRRHAQRRGRDRGRRRPPAEVHAPGAGSRRGRVVAEARV